VFFSSEKRGQDAGRDAERLLSELQAGRGPANPLDGGDPTLLPAAMESASSQEIANTFGSEFATRVEDAPVGQWAGPFESGYGVHIVRVDQRDPGVMPALAEIRPLVEREWASEQRTRTNKELLDKLLEKYEVRIEGPLGEALKQAGPQGAGPKP
jgi:parvulin-like peptidyl-prolyl isomerase